MGGDLSSNKPKICHHRVWWKWLSDLKKKKRSRVQLTALRNTFLPFCFAHSQISLCINYLGLREEKMFLNTVNDWHIKNGQEQEKALWYRVEVSLRACKRSPWTHLGGSWKKICANPPPAKVSGRCLSRDLWTECERGELCQITCLKMSPVTCTPPGGVFMTELLWFVCALRAASSSSPLEKDSSAAFLQAFFCMAEIGRWRNRPYWARLAHFSSRHNEPKHGRKNRNHLPTVWVSQSLLEVVVGRGGGGVKGDGVNSLDPEKKKKGDKSCVADLAYFNIRRNTHFISLYAPPPPSPSLFLWISAHLFAPSSVSSCDSVSRRSDFMLSCLHG